MRFVGRMQQPEMIVDVESLPSQFRKPLPDPIAFRAAVLTLIVIPIVENYEVIALPVLSQCCGLRAVAMKLRMRARIAIEKHCLLRQFLLHPLDKLIQQRDALAFRYPPRSSSCSRNVRACGTAYPDRRSNREKPPASRRSHTSVCIHCAPTPSRSNPSSDCSASCCDRGRSASARQTRALLPIPLPTTARDTQSSALRASS